MPRRFPPPWTAEQIPGGYVVKDATGQSLAYVYARETKAQADTAKVLTMDRDAPSNWGSSSAWRRVTSGFIRLPYPLTSDSIVEAASLVRVLTAG
jgi:hypothetical protein